MNYLVDTHIFLWILFTPKKISKEVKEILLDLEQTKYVSIITFWEISLKFSLGKIDLRDTTPERLPIVAKETGFKILPFDTEIAASSYQLPKLKNKDPFDRMLAWQAIKKDCILLTRDKGLVDYKEYGLKILW